FYPPSFPSVVALGRAASHGYAMRRAVGARAVGEVRLWPATPYRTLAELARLGLIEETGSPGGPDDDPRRRYYAITMLGRQVLAAEAQRLESLARLARARLASGEAPS